jgi:cation diffusion facilitator family transporter
VVASGIAFASVRIGARPADTGHPYGHGRAETMAATAQGLLIGAGGLFIVFRSVQRFVNPPEAIAADLGILVMLLAAAVNLGVSRYAVGAARATGSPAIAADARHLMTNVVQAGAVVAGLALVAATGELAFDSLVAFVLGLYLLWTSLQILWAAGSDVMDASLSAPEVRVIEEIIRAEGSATGGFHQLRTRRSGQSRHIDFHLDLPREMSVGEAHAIVERIQSRLEERWPGAVITIHADPAEAS